jgi:hypothetical protein
VRSELRDGQVIVAAEFADRTQEHHRRLIELMFCSPDSWDSDHGIAMDSSEHIRRILGSVKDLLSRRRALRRMAPRFSCDLPVVLMPANKSAVTARATDISHAGIGISVARDADIPEGAEVALVVSWNQYEHTTFQVHVVNVQGDKVGLTFVHLNGQQQADLFKHIYGRSDAAAAERKVA